jgi:hypothetical protein
MVNIIVYRLSLSEIAWFNLTSGIKKKKKNFEFVFDLLCVNMNCSIIPVFKMVRCSVFGCSKYFDYVERKWLANVLLQRHVLCIIFFLKHVSHYCLLVLILFFSSTVNPRLTTCSVYNGFAVRRRGPDSLNDGKPTIRPSMWGRIVSLDVVLRVKF